MTRNEWTTLYRSLRKTLRDNPKTEAASRSAMHNGIEWTARLCRCPNCKGQPVNVMPSMIRQRPPLMRMADEWRWIALDRKAALRNSRGNGLDKRAYMRGIEFLRDLRTA